MVRAVSFDFHDTIAIAPSWLQLEIRHLAASTHADLVAGGHLPPGPTAAVLTDTYRQLRLEIHEHGQEQDALTCVAEVFRRLGIAVPHAAMAASIERLQRAALADCRPRPGIVTAIQRLAAAGLPIGITSSAVYHDFLLWTLDAFGLRPYLTSIVTSASCGYYKSRPEIYHCTATALGVAVSELVHIGDSFRWDVTPVYHLGGRAIWLNLTGAPAPDADIAHLAVSSLDGLAETILTLCQPGR